MTSNEILKADVLDILFENRNKQYGAYALRKYYNNRLAMALGIALTAVVLASLLIRNASLHRPSAAIEPDPDPLVLRPVDLIEPPPRPRPADPLPPAPARPVASQTFLNRIEIVAEVDPQDLVPQVSDLVDRQIGSVTQDGGLPAENRTTETPALQPGEEGGRSEADGRFTAVEQLPEFPGGVQAWSAFLSRYLRVPAELEAGERRTVQVRFWVGVDGSVTQFEVVQSAGAAFDQEVIRVLKKMPRWKPAIQNGHPVAVTFTQPVTFQAFEE